MAVSPNSSDLAHVSIITPVYNAEKYLAQAIESVLGQTWGNFEHILVDDLSSDSSREIAKEYSCRDNRVKCLFLPRNSGPANARNCGIRASNGNFIAFLDADDLWAPEKLEKQVAVYYDRPTLGIVGTNGFTIDSQGAQTGRMIRSEKIRRGRITLSDFILKGVPLATSSVMVRKEYLDRCGLFKEIYPIGEDYELWMRLIQACEVDFIDEELICYRRHGGNVTTGVVRGRASKVRILENEVLPHLDLLGGAAGSFLLKLQRMYTSLGRMQMAEGRRQEAAACFDKALRLERRSLPVTARARLYRFVNRFR